MAGLDAVVDGMEAENETVRAQSQSLHEELWGKGSLADSEKKQMRIMAAHDVHVYGPPPSGPSAVPVVADSPSPKKSPIALTKALPYVLTALTTAGGLGGAGWAAGLFDKPEPPAMEAPAAADMDTTRRVEVEVWRPEQ